MDESVKAKMVTDLYAECPVCEIGRFGIRHSPGTYGPWGCSTCGARYKFTIDGSDVDMVREPISDTPAWLIVTIGDSEPPVYAVIDSPIYAHSHNDTPEERADQTRFWIEENTCPTNLIRIPALVHDGDEDPHGVLQYVAHVPKANWVDDEPAEGWAAMIDAALKEG